MSEVDELIDRIKKLNYIDRQAVLEDFCPDCFTYDHKCSCDDDRRKCCGDCEDPQC